MHNFSAVAGLDLSLNSFTTSLISSNEKFKSKIKTFKRTKEGLEEFVKWIENQGFPKEKVLVVMEATNNFWEEVAVKLAENKIAVSVINPRVIKDFARSLQRKAKTDKIDAEVIALYGVRMKPKVLDISKSKRFGKLRNLVREREFWLREKVRLENYERTLKSGVFVSEEGKERVKEMIEKVLLYIEEIEQEIKREIEKEEELREALKIVGSIPGIGEVNGVVILVETGLFKGFRRGKEVVSYAGIVPRVYESGTRKGSKGITREGNRRLRQAVYFAAVASLRSKCGVFKEFYDRLKERGKAKKVALVALAGKILRIAFALVKKREYFDARKLRSQIGSVGA